MRGSYLQVPISLLLSLLSISSLVRGQEFSYVNYNVKDGLAGSVVYCMVQDHDGFIWFGTETGLSRFDGSRFRNYTTADGLSDNEVLRLFVDSKNRVWIIPFNKRPCYFLDGKIHNVENDSLLSRLKGSGEVINIMENEKHDLAIVQAELASIVEPNGKIRVIKNFPFFMRYSIAGLDFDGSFQVGVFVDKIPGACMFNVSGDSLVLPGPPNLTRVALRHGSSLSADLKIFHIPPDSLLFQMPNGKFYLPPPPNFINTARLNDSIIAITSQSYTQTINILQQKPENYFLRGKNISSVLQDREGNLWFSSLDKGVYRLPSTNFKTLFFEQNGNRLPAYSLAKRGDMILIGTDDLLLWKWNSEDGQLQNLRVSRGSQRGRVVTIDETERGDIVAGTDFGLYLIGKQGIRSSHKFPVKAVLTIGDDIYTGHDKLLEKLDYRSLLFTEILLEKRITSIFKRNDSVFIGTLNGLYLRTDNGRLSYLGDSDRVLTTRIGSIKETPDGTIWIGTYGGGVALYRNGKVFHVLNEQTGLTSNIARSIFVDNKNAWIGTDKGLNKVAISNGEYRTTKYTTADGLISDMINAVMVDGNTVYVCTPEGMTYFDESKVFTGSMCVLKILGVQSGKLRQISDWSRLHFDHYDFDIRFDFTGISFKSAGDITYHYRLRGLDEGWQTTRNNFLHYPRLPSGEYILQLQAVNKFNIASEIIDIPFTVESLLWEKNWFQILAVIFFGFLVWIFVVARIRTIRKKERVRAETTDKIRELEQMALRAQMNPHFIFNCLNSIQEFVFDKDIQGANRFITGFSRLIRLTLEISSKPKITLQEEIDFLTSYLELEKKRFARKFDYRIQVSDKIDLDACMIPPMILQPYVENSIRHGIRYREDNAGLILINFIIKNDYLLCSIEDNGIGREHSKRLKGLFNVEYQSRGMSLTAKRIGLMNQSHETPIIIDIEDIYTDGVPGGTKIILRFPIKEM